MVFESDGRTSFINSTLVDIEADDSKFEVFDGTLSIRDSVLRNCHSRFSFGLFTERANLNITDSQWTQVSSATAQGFELTARSLRQKCFFFQFHYVRVSSD